MVFKFRVSVITTSAFDDSVLERSLETKSLKKIVLILEKNLINFHSNQGLFLYFFPFWRLWGRERSWGTRQLLFL